MATWIIVIAGIVVALIAGLAVLVVLFATRQRTKPALRLPGFGRVTSRDADDRPPPPD